MECGLDLPRPAGNGGDGDLQAPLESFYRRELPAPGVAFSSEEGRLLFREALADGSMEAYFPVAEQLHTQPSFCGLATLVMVLNALAIDPGIVWKGD
ncbi:Phytochelatin synthase-domain-containing protein [Pavlovales sp. CCMP2436]|nr:Phytochelatin synthase-domain-containing protein [Pavlovales sp. CCMP2436]